MKRLINQIKRSKFIKNVIVMASGTVGAQVITIVSSPIITRLYGPEAFGIMGTFNSIISILGPVAALTYPFAIVLPKKDQDAKGLIRLSLLITGIISIFSLLFLIMFNKPIVDTFNLRQIDSYIYLIPFIIIFTGLLQVIGQWLIRTQQFSVNAQVTFLQSLIINGSMVGIGLFYPIASVLVILTTIKNGLRALLMFIFAKKSKIEEDQNYKKKKLKELAKEYIDFPMYRAPETFFSSISSGLPVLMLNAFFGAASAGFYSIGRTVLSIPSQLIGKSVEDVFYPRIARAANNGENVTELIFKATLALGALGIIPFGIVVLFGPFIFGFVFGSEWLVAGEYARWIALSSFSSFINRPSVRSLAVLNAQRFHLIYTIFMLLTRIILLGIGFYLFSNDIMAVALFGISGLILNLGLITITLGISRKRSNRTLR